MGEKTLNEYFYKPSFGAEGEIEMGKFHDALDVADAQIEANKGSGHTQNTDTDLDATFEATFVKKTDSINVLSDITSPGMDIEDAVALKHVNASNIVLCADYTNPDDAITAIGADNKTLLVTEAETCDTNFTVPANVTVWFERGGKWTINNGITVTFNGQIDAGLWQIFEYVGTGTLAGTAKVESFYPQWFGAIGDGVVDDTTAIQQAMEFTNGGILFFSVGTYLISGNLEEDQYNTWQGASTRYSIIKGDATPRTLTVARTETTGHYTGAEFNNLTFEDVRIIIGHATKYAVGTTFKNCDIKEGVIGGNAVTFTSNAWQTLFIDCKIHNCAIGVLLDFSGATNSGGLIAFTNTHIFNVATCFKSDGMTADGMNVVFTGCVLSSATDYGLWTVAANAGAVFSLFSCHFEDISKQVILNNDAIINLLDTWMFAIAEPTVELIYNVTGRIKVVTGRIATNGAAFKNDGSIPIDIFGTTITGSSTGLINYVSFNINYEEGTWTIGVSFGGGTTGITYGAYTGYYTKIGNLVTISGFMNLTSKGESIGAALITGLPFTVVNNDAGVGAVTLRFYHVTFANQFQGYTNRNTKTIGIEQITEAGAATALTDADFANDSQITVNCTYRCQ